MKLQAKVRLLAKSSGHLLFNSKQINDNRRVDYKSREKLVSMPIREFLKLAKPGRTLEKEQGVRDLLERGQQFDTLPYLYFELRDDEAFVTGHEGRHRARALLELGYKELPVLLKGPIRWSEQESSSAFDYLEVWPAVLWSEDHASYFPFPVSREDAAKPYAP